MKTLGLQRLVKTQGLHRLVKDLSGWSRWFVVGGGRKDFLDAGFFSRLGG
jgi:hypothetical protein